MLIYEEPDILTHADWEVLNELNSRIAWDPSYPLPEGYMKVKEKEVTYDYRVQNYIGVGEEYSICAEILDEILFGKFGFHVLEGMMRFEEHVWVKPRYNATQAKVDPYLAINKLGPKP